MSALTAYVLCVRPIHWVLGAGLVLTLAIGIGAIIYVATLPSWAISVRETDATTSAQQAAAVRCVPHTTRVTNLASFPNGLDINFRASKTAAEAATRCVDRSLGVKGATLISW